MTLVIYSATAALVNNYAMVQDRIALYSDCNINWVGELATSKTSLKHLLRGYWKTINYKRIFNRPINHDTVKIAKDIYIYIYICNNYQAPSRKESLAKINHVQTAIVSHILLQIFKAYKYITLCGDVIFVNKAQFLTMISCEFWFSIVTYFPSVDSSSLLSTIAQVALT